MPARRCGRGTVFAGGAGRGVMPVSVALRVLLVEDNADDAGLIVRALERGGFQPDWVRVETEAAFLAELTPGLDLILCDHSMPQFSAIRALALLQERGRDVPFVIVSGMIGDDLGVQAMHAGADDYVLKDRLSSLGGAVMRALESGKLRDQKRLAEDSLKQLVRNAVYGMYRVTEAGRFLAVNPALCAMLGYDSEAELIGTPIWLLYADPAERSRLLAQLPRNAVIEGAEVQWKRKDGRPIGVRLSGIRFTDPGTGLDGFEMIAEDVTRRRALENELRHAQKMEAVGQLAGGIAHDFNNLLTAILGYADLALSQARPDGRWTADIREIQRAAERATHLTRQLLAFSRKEMVTSQFLRLDQLTTQMMPLLQRLLGEDIRLQITGDPAPVRADPGHLEQVVMNLAVNARDAMPTGGSLEIDTAVVTVHDPAARGFVDLPPGDYAQLTVTDTGCGMNGDTQSHLFEPFFTTKEPGKGTGLGLSTVYGIVAQNNGRIQVDSQVGRGTTFRIYLPCVEAPQEELEPTGLGSPSADSGTVLLVEDDDAVRKLLAASLRRKGYPVLEAANGEEGTALFEQWQADVQIVVTDVVMPKMSGAALVGWLRRVAPDVRVLYLSGYTEDAMVRHQITGMPFLQKPFTTQAFLDKVRGVLNSRFPGGAV